MSVHLRHNPWHVPHIFLTQTDVTSDFHLLLNAYNCTQTVLRLNTQIYKKHEKCLATPRRFWKEEQCPLHTSLIFHEIKVEIILCNAPRHSKEHCLKERSDTATVCPSGKSNMQTLGEDECRALVEWYCQGKTDQTPKLVWIVFKDTVRTAQ